VATDAQDLLRALLVWQPGQDLRPLVKRAVELFGAAIVIDLPKDPPAARDQLLEMVQSYLERPRSDAAGADR